MCPSKDFMNFGFVVVTNKLVIDIMYVHKRSQRNIYSLLSLSSSHNTNSIAIGANCICNVRHSIYTNWCRPHYESRSRSFIVQVASFNWYLSPGEWWRGRNNTCRLERLVNWMRWEFYTRCTVWVVNVVENVRKSLTLNRCNIAKNRIRWTNIPSTPLQYDHACSDKRIKKMKRSS